VKIDVRASYFLNNPLQPLHSLLVDSLGLDDDSITVTCVTVYCTQNGLLSFGFGDTQETIIY
jgi:hypothetical protein